MRTALYRAFDKDARLLYVGISFKPIERLGSHTKSAEWPATMARFEVEWFDSRETATKAEVCAIKAEKPEFNKLHLCIEGTKRRSYAMNAHKSIINRFGGYYKLAKILGHKHPSKTQSWYANGIPKWRWHEVLMAARKLRLGIKEADFGATK